MQKTLLVSAVLWMSTSLLTAQIPSYLLYERSCMDQLEYRNVATGLMTYAYVIKPASDYKYIVTLDAEGIQSQGLPQGYRKCSDAVWNDAVVDAINGNRQQTYIVFQTAYGFTMYPIREVLRIQRTGSRYEFKSKDFQFALDTNRLMLQTNLAYAGSSHYVFYNGIKQEACLRQYSFQLEPTTANGKRVELELIPTIGMMAERTGNTTGEADQHHLRLNSINKVLVDDYISKACPNANARSTIPMNTPEVYFQGSGSSKGFASEQDKESRSTYNKWGISGYNANGQVQNWTPPNAGNAPGLVNCPTPPGPGYHVVQPGEHLNAIARTYGVSADNIIRWNKLKKPNHLEVCQKLYLQEPSTVKETRQYTTKSVPQTLPTVVKQTEYWSAPDGRTYKDLAPGQTAPNNMARVHVVQIGDNLSSIARQYGYTESYLRQINNLPEKGNVIIYPGQTLTIVDCPPEPANSRSVVSPYAKSGYNQEAVLPTPSNTAAGAYSAQREADKTPQSFSESSVTQPYNDSPTPQSVTGYSYLKEHIVKQGDTVRSIAIQYNVSPVELATLNSVSIDETLIAGKTFQIPMQ